MLVAWTRVLSRLSAGDLAHADPSRAAGRGRPAGDLHRMTLSTVHSGLVVLKSPSHAPRCDRPQV